MLFMKGWSKTLQLNTTAKREEGETSCDLPSLEQLLLSKRKSEELVKEEGRLSSQKRKSVKAKVALIDSESKLYSLK